MKRVNVTVAVVASLLFAGSCFAAGGNSQGQNGNNQGQNNRVAAPEIHPAGTAAVATLLTGAFALIAARRRTTA